MFRRSVPACFALALSLPGLAVQAQALADVPPPPRLEAAPPAARSASAPVLASTQTPAPARAPARAASAVPSNTRVIEDDDVRIEESRGKQGQLQRITVRNKPGGKSYEIIVGPAGQDPSQPRGTAGQRAWSLFDF